MADAVAKSYGDKIVETKPVIDKNSEDDKKIIILQEKRNEILNGLRQVL